MLHPKLHNIITELSKPSSKRLFETIKNLPETTYLAILPLSNKSMWLFHVNLLLKVTVKKCIIHIKLKQEPTQSGSEGDKNPNISNLGNGGKRFSVVNTICLSITFGYKMSFVALNRTIRIILHCKNPTTTNN